MEKVWYLREYDFLQSTQREDIMCLALRATQLISISCQLLFFDFHFMNLFFSDYKLCSIIIYQNDFPKTEKMRPIRKMLSLFQTFSLSSTRQTLLINRNVWYALIIITVLINRKIVPLFSFSSSSHRVVF